MADSEAKPNLVFLHGWTMEGRIFNDAMARLEDRFSCYTLDLPGHGKSGSRYPLTIDGAADCVRDDLKENAIENPVLVGWSLGATVAWNFIRRFPGIPIRGLAVIDMSPKILNDEGWDLGIYNLDAAKNERTLARMQEDWGSYISRINESTFAPGNPPMRITHAIMKRQNPIAMAVMWQALSKADERDTIAHLPCPMLIISGAKSRIYAPGTARFLKENAPDATHVVFENSGHAPLLEEPERFAETLKNWALHLNS